MLALEINLKWKLGIELLNFRFAYYTIQQLQTFQRHENGGLSTVDRGL